MKDFDYSSQGWYFLTICTYKKELFLGIVDNSSITLSEAGKLVKNYWEEIPKHFPAVSLDEFVIMPNHLHGILRIENNSKDVGVQYIEPLKKQQSHKYQQTIPQSIGSIIRVFKAAVTRQCRKNDLDFAWQRSYYEQIIRSEKQLNAIRGYIISNPQNWERDTEFIKGR